jgi:hypothetical protein
MSNNQRHNLETFFLIVTAPELGLSLCQWVAQRCLTFSVVSVNIVLKWNMITNGVIRGALHGLHEGGLFFRNIASFQDTNANAISSTTIFTRPTKRPTATFAQQLS